MTSVKSLGPRIYRLNRGADETGEYLKLFGHCEANICWFCPAGAVAMLEHLSRHCSGLKDQQKSFWKIVGKATGWKAGRCRDVQICKLLSIEICDHVVMDSLAANDIRKIPPRQGD